MLASLFRHCEATSNFKVNTDVQQTLRRLEFNPAMYHGALMPSAASNILSVTFFRLGTYTGKLIPKNACYPLNNELPSFGT
jgi:hypothetical protein